MADPVLDVASFYAAVGRYLDEVDPKWADDDFALKSADERLRLARVLGAAEGRTLLDCSCGTGNQAIPLAQLGWNVTAADIAPASLDLAKRRAAQAGVDIEWHLLDVREIARPFRARFDRVISCMALDNLLDDAGIAQAAAAMFAALKPGGRCYLRLRDFDHLLAVRPRYDVKEERLLAHGRVLRLEDWSFESDTHVIYHMIFLHEDRQKEGYRWTSSVFSLRRRALRKGELARILAQVSFNPAEFVPQGSPWEPYDIIAVRPSWAPPVRCCLAAVPAQPKPRPMGDEGTSALLRFGLAVRWRPARTLRDRQAEKLLPGPDVIGEGQGRGRGTTVVAAFEVQLGQGEAECDVRHGDCGKRPTRSGRCILTG
jgi:SAM-dependent methyltransferase